VKIKSNKIKDIRDYHLDKLSKLYPALEAAAMLDAVFEELAGVTKIQRLTNPELRVSESEMITLHQAAKSLCNWVPVQYVTGNAWFYGLKLQVNSSVLIPRPETEELVEWIIRDNQKSNILKFLDIGTGSGAIAIAVKQHLKNFLVSSCDVSVKALEVAGKNAADLFADIDFIRADILDEKQWSRFSEYDVIVSNPPYILPSEKKFIKANVLKYEPENALFVPENDPLIFYKKLATFGQKKLFPGGKIYVEINEKFGSEVMKLFHLAGYSKIVLRQDMNQKDRMIRAEWLSQTNV
jgi:release factor glutamine methyltransferase